ncbi:MAG: PP2C family protein-serine/threonine phosphatase [Candidatus Zixiibacteriota bacterium]
MKTDSNDNLAKEWPQARQYRRSIRLEFSLYISAIVLILMAVTGWVITDKYVSTINAEVVDKLVVQARSYSGPAGKLIISANGPDALLLNNICKKLATDNPEIYWAGITDKNGTFLAHTDFRQVIASTRINDIGYGEHNERMGDGESFSHRGDTIYISVPIWENSVQVGGLALASSTRHITEARRESITTVVTITVVMILMGLPVTLMVLHRKLRPISIITDNLKNIKFDNIAIDIPLHSKNEFGYLAETMRVMGAKLNQAQKDLIERERIARELEIAREIQKSILPEGFPSGKSFEIAGVYRSAREVGGDYYDFIEFDNNRLGVVVADVSGKSLPGMLVMLLTRDIIKKVARHPQRPSQILSEVNRELAANIKKGMFVTMFFGILDQATGCFTFASAGHNPLLWYDSVQGECKLIKTKGFPLGMTSAAQFSARIEDGEIRLSESDWIIQYTDGINEARNNRSEEFGMERFMHAVTRYNSLQPKDLVSKTIVDIESFAAGSEQSDDITLIALKWSGDFVDNKHKAQMKVNSCVSQG